MSKVIHLMYQPLKADLSDSDACPLSSVLYCLGDTSNKESSRQPLSILYTQSTRLGLTGQEEVQIQEFCERDSSDHYPSDPGF